MFADDVGSNHTKMTGENSHARLVGQTESFLPGVLTGLVVGAVGLVVPEKLHEEEKHVQIERIVYKARQGNSTRLQLNKELNKESERLPGQLTLRIRVQALVRT